MGQDVLPPHVWRGLTEYAWTTFQKDVKVNSAVLLDTCVHSFTALPFSPPVMASHIRSHIRIHNPYPTSFVYAMWLVAVGAVMRPHEKERKKMTHQAKIPLDIVKVCSNDPALDNPAPNIPA